MHVNVAGQTIRKHFQLFLVMRSAVTIYAVRDTSVRLMTPDARHLPVFAWRFLPLLIDLIMTGATSLQCCVRRQINSQRRMYTLVTRFAVFEWLGLVMAIMTLRTIRDIAVFLVMTTLTILLRMHTGKLCHLFLWARMAIRTGRS